MVGIAGEIDGWFFFFLRPSCTCDDLLNGRQIIVLGVRGKRVPLLLEARRSHWNQAPSPQQRLRRLRTKRKGERDALREGQDREIKKASLSKKAQLGTYSRDRCFFSGESRRRQRSWRLALLHTAYMPGHILTVNVGWTSNMQACAAGRPRFPLSPAHRPFWSIVSGAVAAAFFYQ
jgi:hypothetical protein